MNLSNAHRRRILRSGDGMDAAAASLLVDVPGAGDPGHDGAGGLNQMIDQARREGYDEGYRAAVEETAAAEAAGRAAQLRRVADAIVDATAQIRETRHEAVTVAAGEAAQLAYEIAEAFLQRELTVGRPVIDAVVRALALVPDEEDLTVRVNPSDPVTPEEISGLLTDTTVKVVADPRVEAGGCVVQAGPCRIDAQLGTALERVRRVLAEAYPESAPDLAVVEEVA